MPVVPIEAAILLMPMEVVTIGNQIFAACNYAEGKWVVDERRPLYSGYHCKQWLSAMWACRLTQRMNFDYETLRWQPRSCQMENFEGQKFLKRYFSEVKQFGLFLLASSVGHSHFPFLRLTATARLLLTCYFK